MTALLLYDHNIRPGVRDGVRKRKLRQIYDNCEA
nr:MAG TPA: hypothetical protein [Bacteriophage sp.]